MRRGKKKFRAKSGRGCGAAGATIEARTASTLAAEAKQKTVDRGLAEDAGRVLCGHFRSRNRSLIRVRCVFTSGEDGKLMGRR